MQHNLSTVIRRLLEYALDVSILFNEISKNLLHAKFFRENINIYLHFVSYLHIDTTQVIEILPQIRQEPTYST